MGVGAKPRQVRDNGEVIHGHQPCRALSSKPGHPGDQHGDPVMSFVSLRDCTRSYAHAASTSVSQLRRSSQEMTIGQTFFRNTTSMAFSVWDLIGQALRGPLGPPVRVRSREANVARRVRPTEMRQAKMA